MSVEFMFSDEVELPHDGYSINISSWLLLLIFMEANYEVELQQVEGRDRNGFVSTDDPVSTLCISRGFTSFSLVAWTETC